MTTTEPKSIKTAWAVLFLCCLGMISTMFLRTCPAILALDLQQTFAVSPTDVALFSSATLLGYGLMQTPSGLITDAIGGRKALALFVLLAGLSTLGFAFAIKFELAVLARFVKGLSITIVPPAMTVISRYFPREKQTQAMGIFMGCSAIGTLLAAEPLARLSIAVGWRYAMALVGVLIVILAVVIFVRIRDINIAPDQSQQTHGKLKGVGLNMLKVLRTRQFWYIGIWQVFTASTFFAFMTMWAGPYLMEGYALSKIEASRILLTQGVCALIMVPLIGYVADRIGSRKIMIVICSVAGLTGNCGLAFFAGQLPIPLLTASLALISSFSTGAAACSMALISRNFPKSMTGTGIGCMNMLWPIAASVMGVLFGLALQFNTARLGAVPGVPSPALSQAYGDTLLLIACSWAISLVLAVFFLRERFTVSGE